MIWLHIVGSLIKPKTDSQWQHVKPKECNERRRNIENDLSLLDPLVSFMDKQEMDGRRRTMGNVMGREVNSKALQWQRNEMDVQRRQEGCKREQNEQGTCDCCD